LAQPHLHQELDLALTARSIFVLNQTSHPGNIGASARSLAVLDFPAMRCAAPRNPDWKSHPDALARASGALALLDQASSYPSLDAAIADCHWVIMFSADVRDFGPDLVDVSVAAAWAVERLRDNVHAKVALVFGSERYGLSREEAARGHLLASIPGQPAYHSLNLSQAVTIAAWELRKQLLDRYQEKVADPEIRGQRSEVARHNHGEQQIAGGRPMRLAAPPLSQPATAQAFEALIEHLEAAASAVGFLDPEHPKMLIPRLRRLLMRSELRAEEVDLLRGLCSAIMNPRQREGKKQS
jgi:tRNA/rRNA methyltransferase